MSAQAISPRDLQVYVNSLNAICSRNNIPITFFPNEWKNYLILDKGKKIWWYNGAENKIKQRLFDSFPDLKQTPVVHRYRFLPYARFNGLFATRSLRMSSMAVNRKFNGPGEYEDYFKAISLRYDKTSIDNTAARTYLMCFISDWNKKYMWENYVNNYEGFCIEVDVLPKDSKNYFWNFREVSYKDPLDYKWISDAIDFFKSQYDIDIVLPWSAFAYIYKGPKFKDEIETRIYIPEQANGFFRSNYIEAVGKNHPTKSYVDKDSGTFFYLDMPLKNDLFEIEIKKVYLGKRTSDAELKRMESVLQSENIPFEEICMCDSRLQ